jgi:lipoprotein-releasing system permease protein
VFFISGSAEINGLVKGVDIEEEVRLFGLDENIIQGNYLDLKRIPNGIILGKDLSSDLSLGLGDQVEITTSTGSRKIMKVVAISQVGSQQIDGTQAYISLNSAQAFNRKPPGFYTEIGVQLKDISTALPVSGEFQRRFRTKALDYKSSNAQIETGSSVRTIISYAVGITLLIVAGFGIYNILNIMIYEKMNDIAILKATGFSGRDVNIIFISQALLIGLVGGIAGLTLGYGLSALISTLPFSTPALPSMKTYPVNFKPGYYLVCMVFSLVTTFMAGFLPARKAARIDPVEIIRSQ